MKGWRRKPIEVEAELLIDGKVPLYRMAAWIIEHGGKAWVVDNYESQGPDVLHLQTVDRDDTPFLPGMWVVYHKELGFKVVTQENFAQDYERIT